MIAVTASTESVAYAQTPPDHSHKRGVVIAMLLVVILGVALAASAFGWSSVIRNSVTSSGATEANASAASADPLAEWAPTAVSAATKSDAFRRVALEQVKSGNYAAAVDPLRNAGEVLVVVPESPDKGVSSGLMRKIGMSFMTAALHLQNGNVDGAAAAIEQVNAGYTQLSEHLRGTSGQGLGQLT